MSVYITQTFSAANSVITSWPHDSVAMVVRMKLLMGSVSLASTY